MNVFITGSTGLLGGEVLVSLSLRPEVERIYCLVRAASQEAAEARLEKVFNLHGDLLDSDRIKAIPGDLFDEHLIEKLRANELVKDTDFVIHSAANTSFSSWHDNAVEQANIEGLKKLLVWAQGLVRLQTFMYIGTATICGKDVRHRVVQEVESPNLKATHLVHYTQTKMNGEILLQKYLRPDQVLIARPSVVMGDSRPHIPRSPVILWALATVNHLRMIPVNQEAKLDIIPVDYAARAIVELVFARRNFNVYHVSAGVQGATTLAKLTDVLNEASGDRPDFRFINKDQVKSIKLWARGRDEPLSKDETLKKYFTYWEKNFESRGDIRLLFTGLEVYLDFVELGHIFDNSKLVKDLNIENSVPADIYIRNSLQYLEKINIMEGAIDP